MVLPQNHNKIRLQLPARLQFLHPETVSLLPVQAHEMLYGGSPSIPPDHLL